MPRRPIRLVPTVVVPGWQGSGAGHWQTWLEERSAELGRPTRRPDFAELDRPDLAQWLAALRASLADLPDGGFDVVAHSLGAVLWLHYVTQSSEPRPARVLLVAPPSPRTAILEIAGFFPPPLDVDAVRAAAGGTVLVGGDADPYVPEGVAAAYGLPLRLGTTVIPGAGHVNVESGHGPWPAVLDWCGRDNLAFY